MNRNLLTTVVLSTVVFFSVGLCVGWNQISKAQFRIVRSICGSSGSQESDRFVVRDPRSIFYLPEDKQVVVYLELEGPVGSHRLEGFWKNPAGKVASLSDFSYTSKERVFSSHFTLAILESAATGTWSLEVHVDGELLSEIKFQLTAGIRADQPTQLQKLLSPAEIFKLASASTVIIERIGKDRELLGTSTGFVARPGIVISTIEAIDGASRLRLTFPSGRQLETDQVLSWSRKKGYSVIGIDSVQTPALLFARENSWNIGDTGTFLEIPPDSPKGSWVISEVKIIGKTLEGDRISLSGSASEKAMGGVLLNEYGEVIGIIGSPAYPWGISSNEVMAVGFTTRKSHGMAIPIDIVNLEQTSPSTLGKLALAGELLLPISNRIPILYAQLTHRIEKGETRQWPVDNSSEFFRRDGKIGIFVMWTPKEKLKGIVDFFLYNDQNNLLASSRNRTEVNFKPDRQISTAWEMEVSRLNPGIYRIDVQISGVPYWRKFFRIAD